MIRFRCLLRLDCGFLLTSLLFPEILDLPEFPVLPEIPDPSEALLLLPATGVLAPSLIRLPVSELPVPPVRPYYSKTDVPRHYLFDKI